MAQMPYIAAVDAGIHQEMRRDPNVLYFGQNLATTENHEFVAAYGHDRVRVTPISETAEIGIAIGAAMAGFRPVVELYMAEFMLVAMDQVVNEAPRFRYMSGGQVKVPLVLKAGYGFTAGWAGQHTGSLTALFMGVPGLKVVVPSTAADAKGLMASAIRDDNPVVFLHHYMLTLSTAKFRTVSIWCRLARPMCGEPEATSRSLPRAGWFRAHWPRRSSSLKRGSTRK